MSQSTGVDRVVRERPSGEAVALRGLVKLPHLTAELNFHHGVRRVVALVRVPAAEELDFLGFVHRTSMTCRVKGLQAQSVVNLRGVRS